MSEADLDAHDAEDSIPLGKRLVRAGGGAGLSLGERISAQFYRLTWRTPLHRFRLKGRHPLKLLSAPVDPVAGLKDAGLVILHGHLLLEGEQIECPNEGPDLSRATARMANHYHSFGWLRDLGAVSDRTVVVPRAEGLIRGWLDTHGATVSEPAWSPGVAGRRLLIWPCYAPIILSSSDLVFRSSILNCLARTARHVERSVERTPPGLERIAAWCGVIAAGLIMPGGEARRNYGEAGLLKTLSAQTTSDGGMLSRSPTDQIELIELLSRLRAIYVSRTVDFPSALAESLSKAVPPLLGVALGDGGLSSWQGGIPVSQKRIDSAVAASGERARPLRQAREWGYQRLSGGNTVIVLDAAPPPQSRTILNGCASTFAFELSDGDKRLIVNCGGAAAAGIQSVSGLSQGLRTTAAHSTLVLADTNSTSVLANGTLGRGVDEVELDREEAESGSKLAVSHDGYVRRFGFTHSRSIALSVDGREVRGEDTLLPAPLRKKTKDAAFAVRFHLAPGVEVTPTADAMGALLRIDGGALWQFRCRGGSLSVEPSLWVNSEGAYQQTQQLVIGGEAASGGATIGWVLKRAG
jgi:uncharacterized heparinase superfamily protein